MLLTELSSCRPQRAIELWVPRTRRSTLWVDFVSGTVKGGLKLEPGIVAGIDLSDSRNWVNGIFAVKGKRRLSPTWYLSGYGDIGGSGSNFTYQVIGAAGADFGNITRSSLD